MPSEHPDAISEAAIKLKTGRIITAGQGGGRWHSDAAWRAEKLGLDLTDSVAGFVDNSRKFLDRDQAYARAKKLNQLEENQTLSDKNKKLDAMDFNESRAFMPSEGVESAGAENAPDKTKERAAKLWAEKGTESPFFKKWFGQSKVVDESGKPLVVYHGGNQWDTADTTKGQLGLHIGSEKQARVFLSSGYKGKELKQLYASIHNPIRLEDRGIWGFDQVAPQLEKIGIAIPELIKQERVEFGEYGWQKNGLVPWENAALQKLIKNAGYDGVVYLNRTEGVNHENLEKDPRLPSRAVRSRNDYSEKMLRDHGAHDSYIVFDPTQIKSATGNQGTFDASNPDIRFMPSEGVESMRSILKDSTPDYDKIPASYFRQHAPGGYNAIRDKVPVMGNDEAFAEQARLVKMLELSPRGDKNKPKK